MYNVLRWKVDKRGNRIIVPLKLRKNLAKLLLCNAQFKACIRARYPVRCWSNAYSAVYLEGLRLTVGSHGVRFCWVCSLYKACCFLHIHILCIVQCRYTGSTAAYFWISLHNFFTTSFRCLVLLFVIGICLRTLCPLSTDRFSAVIREKVKH